MKTDVIKNRYEFVLLFDVVDGNPNGDPDGGNMPRIDPETGHGLVTDVCLKRKVRNYVEVFAAQQADEPRREALKIFIREQSILNETMKETVATLTDEEKKLKGAERQKANRDCMCRHFYDVRTFGAVMSTGESEAQAGQVRGPVQMTFARSIDPVFSSEHSITRMAKTDKKDEKENAGPNQTMGSKFTIPYALYRCHGFITPHFAEKTGFSEQDLELFWQSLSNMFELDHSATRGLMSARKLIVFKHDTALGNSPAHKLFDLLTIQAKDPAKPIRQFADYEISLGKAPSGVEVIEII